MIYLTNERTNERTVSEKSYLQYVTYITYMHAFVRRHSKTYLTNCVLGSSKYKRTFNLAVQTINGPLT